MFQRTTVEVKNPTESISNSRYVLKNAFKSDQLVLSRTELKPFQTTRGHSHENEEIYIFQSSCVLQLDEECLDISPGDIILIPSNTYHRVINKTEFVVCFNCFYIKTSTVASY